MDIRDQLAQLDLKQAFIIGIVIAVGYYAALFDDGRVYDIQITQARESIARDQLAMAKIEKARVDEERFNREIREITEHMKDFQNYFPSNFTNNELVQKVTTIAERHELTIINMKPGTNSREFKNYPETALDFIIEGEYHKIMSFVAEVTQFKKAMDFQEMKFVVAQQSDDPRIRLETRLIVYGNTGNLGAGNG